jgi:FtsP/CotA-like multicopper oxidase with cupredoxin domain
MFPPMNRRQMLKLGLMTGITGLASHPPASLQRIWGVGPTRPAGSPPTTPFVSPPTTPFVSPLPIPSPPIQVDPFVPSQVADAQLRDVGGGVIPPNTRFYELIQEEALVRLHPELPLTSVWRYRDVNAPPDSPFALGPTFEANQGVPQVVRQMNRLPAERVSFSVPQTTVHLHGGHHPTLSDGFPANIAAFPVRVVISPGEDFDYVYPHQDVGFTTGTPRPEERPSLLWYHDHLMDFTGANVYRGLAGVYKVFDDLDTGDETTGLRLPSGEFDIPLVVQDKSIAPDGSLVFLPEEENFDGFLGDKFLVNGAINPFLRVQRRKYRFRVLDASTARFYLLSVTDGRGSRQPFDIIATEGGLLSQTLRDQLSFLISVAERREFVFDFSRYPAGTKLFLTDFLRQDDGRGPGGDFERPDEVPADEANRIMKFIVEGGPVADPSEVPDLLRPLPPIPQARLDAAERRTFEFERMGGRWAINDQFFDPDNPLVLVGLDRPQIWTLRNGGGGWWHPIHIHMDFMRVLARNGQRPGPIERDGIAKKDTVLLGPGDEVMVFIEFHDFPGPVVFHCHNTEHEDMFMMARFDIVG